MKDILISRLAAEQPACFRHPASVTSPCSRCNRDLWLSPTSQARVEAGLTAYCADCADVLIREAGRAAWEPEFILPGDGRDQ